MKLLSLLFFLLLTSCKQDKVKHMQVHADSAAYTQQNVKPEKTTQLKFYKCDYNVKKYDTILSSGTEHEITEIWGINKKDIIKFPVLDKAGFDTDKITKRAAQHIKDRFPDIDLLSAHDSIQRINDKDTSNPRNWFVQVTFLYDKRGYYQVVPLLLDGRIILSNNE